jgi:hypothetical protein
VNRGKYHKKKKEKKNELEKFPAFSERMAIEIKKKKNEKIPRRWRLERKQED